MKSFWISLLVFVLLMCSCRTKKVDSNVRVRNDLRSELAYLNESVKINTSKTANFANETKNIVIEEDITETEYDKESGKPTKETKTKRKITQNSDKVASEEEVKGLSEVRNDSLNHFIDVSKMVESEVKEETEGRQEAFGKWLGIVLGCFLVGLFVYLCRKFRVN